MNNNQLPIPTHSRHLHTTKIFFNLVLIVYLVQTIELLVNFIYFAAIPASSIHIVITDSKYSFNGLLGYMGLGFDTIYSNLPVENAQLFALSACILLFITEILPFILILYFGRKILKVITRSYTPFTAETANLIRRIGVILILKGALATLILQSGMNLINFKRVMFNNPLELSWLLAGTMTLMLADIFEKGCSLQQEVDETL